MSAVPTDALTGHSAADAERVDGITRPPLQRLIAYLDGPHADLKAAIRDELARPEYGYRYDLTRPEHCDLILERCRLLAQRRWGDALFPDAEGRSDVVSFLAALETIAISDPNLLIKFGLQFGLFGGAICYLGNREQHRRWLPQVADMRLIGCYAMTELGHGSDIRSVRTTARYDPASNSLTVDSADPSARKQFIGNAGRHARIAVVFAQLIVEDRPCGVFGVLVPIRDEAGNALPGIRIGDTGAKAGLLGIDNGWLEFDQVRVPAENLLDRYGTVSPEQGFRANTDDPTAATLRSMSGGRVAMALAALSGAKAGLTIAIRHAYRRRQFGHPEERRLIDYPVHRRRLLPRLAAVYAMDALGKHAMAQAGHSKHMASTDFEELAALVKASVTWNALDILRECREACGGQGYLAHNRVGTLRADLDPLTTLEGDNTLLFQLVAKSRLQALQARLRSGGMTTAIREAIRLRQDRLGLALSARFASSERIADPRFVLRLLRHREQALLWRAAGRIRTARAGRQEIDIQTPLLDFTRAAAERLTLEHFTRSLASADPSIRPALAELCALHAVSCLDQHLAWHLQTGLLTGRHAHAIEQAIDRLCRTIQANALVLVDAFAIPDPCLGAPIALNTTKETQPCRSTSKNC